MKQSIKCKNCSACKKGFFKSQPDKYVCTGVPEPFVINDIDSYCTEYMRSTKPTASCSLCNDGKVKINSIFSMNITSQWATYDIGRLDQVNFCPKCGMKLVSDAKEILNEDDSIIKNMDKKDCFTYYNCISGNCPLIIEEETYGIITSTCKEYCGNSNFSSCDDCYFAGSKICSNCIHEEKNRAKIKGVGNEKQI